MVSLSVYFAGNTSKKHAKLSDIKNKSIILQKRIYVIEIKRIRRITSFSGDDLVIVQIVVVCIVLLVREPLTDTSIVKYNRQKDK